MLKITDLTVQKKNPNRFNLFIDDKFYCGLSVNTVAKFNIYKDLEIKNTLLNELVNSDLEERIFNRACNYLNRGLKSTSKLRTYIKDLLYKKRGDWFSDDMEFSEDELIDKTITRLEKVGLLDDIAYASAFVRDRLKFKPKSGYALSRELFAKGIGKDIVQKVIAENVNDEYEIMKLAYNKKFRNMPIKNGDNKKINFLRRKGFKWDLISRLIKEHGQSTE